MANEGDLPSSGRNFGHCIVTWKIKNYGQTLWGESLKVSTPYFSIKGPGSKNTRWMLTVFNEPNSTSLVKKFKVDINCKSKNVDLDLSKEILNDEAIKHEKVKRKNTDETESENSKPPIRNLMLILERADSYHGHSPSLAAGSDNGPSTVWLDCKVSFIGIDGEKFPVAHCGKIFKRKYKYGVNMGVIYDLEKEFVYNSGVTTILCDMIVKDVGIDTNIDDMAYIDDAVNIDLRGLSDDLKWIFYERKFCDAEIVAGSKSRMVHKALMCTHGSFFENAFEEQEKDTMDLLDINYNEVIKILEYMYSHELKDVIGRPSVSLYDSITYMNLTDLAAHYEPEEHKITTTLDIRKLTFSWIIENFSSIESISISSPTLCKKIEEAAWQIHFYPKGVDGNGEFIAIAVECVEGDIFKDLDVQCAVLNDNENMNIWKSIKKSNINCVFKNERFILREDLLKLLNNDTLRLGLKIRMCLGKDQSVFSKACDPVLYSEKKSYENMSKNMLALHQSNKFTDITLKIEKEEIKAHKFILSARSRLLSSMLEETSSDSILLSNISPETLEILLSYMYCAVLNVSDIDTIIDVYKAAEDFVIPRLQEKCSRILQNSMNVDTLCNILRLADDYQDHYLKTAALEFISSNEKLIKQRICENRNLERHFLNNEVAEIVKDENSEKPSFSVQSKVKKITILKYNEDSITSIDYEITSKISSEEDILITPNYEGSDDKNLISHEVENGQSDDLLSKCLKESHVNGEEKVFPKVKETTASEVKFSTKPQTSKLDIPLKKRYRNETNFSSNSEGEKSLQECSQTEETINVHIKSDDEATKNIQNSPCDKNANKETSQTASEISSVTVPTDEQTNPINRLKPSTKDNKQEDCKPEEKLEAITSFSELQVKEPKSNTAPNEQNGKGVQSGKDLEELNENRSESNADLDELNGNKLKSNIDLNESSKKGLDVDETLKEP